MRGYYRRLGPEHDERAREEGYGSWAEWVEAMEGEVGYEICGRRKRGDGAPCRNKAGGVGPCAVHGKGVIGLVGAAHPSWKGGRGGSVHSKYAMRAPGRLAEIYAELEDRVQDAFDLTEDVRLLDARMLEMVEEIRDRRRVDAEALDGVVGAARLAVRERSVTALEELMEELEGLRDAARGTERAWRRWDKMVEQKRKLVDTHSRRKARSDSGLSASDVAMIADRLRAGIMKFVPKRQLAEFLDWVREQMPEEGPPIVPRREVAPDVEVIEAEVVEEGVEASASPFVWATIE